VIDATPEILLIAQCGYSVQQARDEYLSMSFPEEWSAIPAVRNSRVYALNASGYFSRPGPRLVSGIEALATILHEGIAISPEAEGIALPIAAERVSDFPPSTRAASA
jgi:iron complex transport system substrate-binding protein